MILSIVGTDSETGFVALGLVSLSDVNLIGCKRNKLDVRQGAEEVEGENHREIRA